MPRDVSLPASATSKDWTFGAMGALRRVPHARDKLMLWILGFHADASGRAWPSIARLCAETGFSRSAVSESLNRLERGGWITVVKREAPDRPRTYEMGFAPQFRLPVVFGLSRSRHGQRERVATSGHVEAAIFEPTCSHFDADVSSLPDAPIEKEKKEPEATPSPTLAPASAPAGRGDSLSSRDEQAVSPRTPDNRNDEAPAPVASAGISESDENEHLSSATRMGQGDTPCTPEDDKPSWRMAADADLAAAVNDLPWADSDSEMYPEDREMAFAVARGIKRAGLAGLAKAEVPDVSTR